MLNNKSGKKGPEINKGITQAQMKLIKLKKTLSFCIKNIKLIKLLVLINF